MKAFCKKDIFSFKKGYNYKINGIYSVFDTDDFITLQIDESYIRRFRMNKSSEYIDDYIGTDELYFYDFFSILNEERKNKLKKLSY